MYIDAHTHLDYFENNIHEAIKQIEENDIVTLAHSLDIKSYEENKQYSKLSNKIIPCFGIHPWKASEYKGNLNDLIPYIEESIMIGEIGLDFHWVEDKSTYDAQRKVFYFQLEESLKRNKVICIHTKGAENEIYEFLKGYDCNKVIIHWYSGDDKVLTKLISLGCYFTISVDIGISHRSNEVLKQIPINRLLTETDGPTAQEWVNGIYGYPIVIKNVINNMARELNLEEDILKNIVSDNFNRLINA
ncbi:MAG: TatD family hydrolase [Clostridium sp.]